jgi:hypothetical protein
MPNFDGNGPLKRGRVIGRGRGPCRQSTGECPRKDTDPEILTENETPEHQPY